MEPEIFEKFQTVKLTATPLAALKYGSTNANKDIQFIHSEVSFTEEEEKLLF